MDRWARFSSCSECYVDRLGFVGFHSPVFKSVLAIRLSALFLGPALLPRNINFLLLILIHVRD
jgi:hypothetical protein